MNKHWKVEPKQDSNGRAAAHAVTECCGKKISLSIGLINDWVDGVSCANCKTNHVPPQEIVNEARELWSKQLHEAAEIRVAGGGSGAFIPI